MNRFGTRFLILPLAALMVASFITPASAADANSIIKAKTGHDAVQVTDAQSVHGLSVGVGHDGTGKVLETHAQHSATSVRMMATITGASQRAVSYPLGLPAGAEVKALTDGSMVMTRKVTDPNHVVGVFGTIAAPWAVDAKGKNLPTSYSYHNGVLTQHVDLAGAAYPVVADPFVTFGPLSFWVHLDPTDQRALTLGGAAGAAAMGGLICVELGPGAAVCAVGAAVVGGILASYISDKFTPNCTLVVEYSYLGGFILGSTTEDCT